MGLNMNKCIPIYGVKFNKNIQVPIIVNNKMYGYKQKFENIIKLMSYNDYLKYEQKKYINYKAIKKCDTIAIFYSQLNNTLEVENIKVILSTIYFANRMTNTEGIKEKYIGERLSGIKGYKEFSIQKQKELYSIFEDEYIKDKNEYLDNYKIPGYFDNTDEIENLYWYISLGNKELTRDDFDRFLTRGFSEELVDEYYRQIDFDNYKYTIEVNVDDTFIGKMNDILDRINMEDEYSKKIKSALRLYYNVLYEGDLEQTILTYATILETLLLKESESSGQKKMVANRCACIIGDKVNKKLKQFIANHVTYFYGYRNSIVHEGKSYLELDNEVTIINIMCSIRHIIYFVFKYIIEKEIKDISEIKDLVTRNKAEDNMSKNDVYSTYSKEMNNAVELIYIDE